MQCLGWVFTESFTICPPAFSIEVPAFRILRLLAAPLSFPILIDSFIFSRFSSLFYFLLSPSHFCHLAHHAFKNSSVCSQWVAGSPFVHFVRFCFFFPSPSFIVTVSLLLVLLSLRLLPSFFFPSSFLHVFPLPFVIIFSEVNARGYIRLHVSSACSFCSLRVSLLLLLHCLCLLLFLLLLLLLLLQRRATGGVKFASTGLQSALNGLMPSLASSICREYSMS